MHLNQFQTCILLQDGNPQVVFSTDRIMVDRDGGQLFFRPLIPEDRGTYMCKAFNDVGESSKIAVLTVVGWYEIRTLLPFYVDVSIFKRSKQINVWIN